jgi:hypothetical protein
LEKRNDGKMKKMECSKIEFFQPRQRRKFGSSKNTTSTPSRVSGDSMV